MGAGKKEKMITLAAAIACLAAAGAGIYFFTGEDRAKMLQKPEITQAEQSGGFADEEKISGHMTQAVNEGTKSISDGFIMLPGGIFSIGSPNSERQR